MADKPTKAVKAEAYETNDAKADDANEAIVDDAANEGIVANEATDSDD